MKARMTIAEREQANARARRMATFYADSSMQLQTRVAIALRRRSREIMERGR